MLKVVPTNYLQPRQLRLALVSKMFKLISISSAKYAEEPASGIISDILQETLHNAPPNPNRKDNNNLTENVRRLVCLILKQPYDDNVSVQGKSLQRYHRHPRVVS
jgi:hypothetical protein